MDSKVRSKFFVCRMNREELAKLKAEASNRHTTGSDLIRTALKEFYEKAA
jgi:hypothetical protein